MAKYTFGRRPAGFERSETTDKCRLLHEETGTSEYLKSFDKGVEFTCGVMEEYMNKGFDVEQLRQIIAALRKKVRKQ